MQLFLNNFASSLSQPAEPGDLALVLPAPAAGRLTGLGAGNYYLLTLVLIDEGTGQESAWEVVKVTANNGGTLTVERQQDGTTARQWPAGSPVELRLTASLVAGVLQAQQTLGQAQTQQAQDLVGLEQAQETLEQQQGAQGLAIQALDQDVQALLAGRPVKTENGASRTLAANDANAYLRCTQGCQIKVTGDSVFSAPTSLVVYQAGADPVRLVPDNGVTLNPANSLETTKPGAALTLVKVGPNTWDVWGDVQVYVAPVVHRYLAVGLWNEPYLKVYDTATGLPVTVPVPGGFVRELAFNADGTRLAVAQDAASKILIINTADWSVVTGPALSGDNVSRLRWSPDGQYLAVVTWDLQVLKVYRTTDWSLVTLPALSGSVYSANWSDNGTWLAVTKANAPRLVVLNTSTWTAVTGITVSGIPNDALFKPGSGQLATLINASPYLRVYNTAGWGLVSGPVAPDDFSNMTFKADGSALLGARSNTPYITAIDTTTWAQSTPLTITHRNAGMSYSDDHEQLAILDTFNEQAFVYDVASGQQVMDPVGGGASSVALF